MGKRYYCDYCARSFADKANNRKNHFNGLQHQRMRKQHYNTFRDAAAILSDESSKAPCKRFNSGVCDYGDDCRFSHLTEDTRRQLEQRAFRDKMVKEEATRRLVCEPEPSLDAWLEAYTARYAGTGQQAPPPPLRQPLAYELAPCLAGIPNIPPSLLPPSSEDMENVHHSKWG